MTINRALQFSAIVGVIFVTALFIAFSFSLERTKGSVIQGNEYNSTTTIAVAVPAERLLKTGAGSLAQVTITGAQVGTIDLYNATTSDVTKRTGQPATSTILIAQFPPSAAVGTYTFDATFTTGLLLITSASPTAPTSTVTWR